MKKFSSQENIHFYNGEIYLISNEKIQAGDWFFRIIPVGIPQIREDSYTHYRGDIKILASTKKLEGIPLLDRSKFFKQNKPTDAYEFLPEVVKKHLNYVSFEIGYNANKAEFTKDDIIEAMNAVVLFYDRYPSIINIPEYIRGYLDGKQPLTLPKSIECDDNYKILKIEW